MVVVLLGYAVAVVVVGEEGLRSNGLSFRSLVVPVRQSLLQLPGQQSSLACLTQQDHYRNVGYDEHHLEASDRGWDKARLPCASAEAGSRLTVWDGRVLA